MRWFLVFVPGEFFFDGVAGGLGPRVFVEGPAEIEEAEHFVFRSDLEEGVHLWGGEERGTGPEGGEAGGGGGEVHVLDGAGDGGNFVEFGYFFDVLAMHDDGDHEGREERVGAELFEFIRADIFGGRGFFVDSLEGVGEALAGVAGEEVKAPRFGHAVGGGPVSVFENVLEEGIGDGGVGIDESGLDGAAVSNDVVHGFEVGGWVHVRAVVLGEA